MLSLPKSILLLLVVTPAFVSAGLFGPSSQVTVLDHAGFKKVMKEQVLKHVFLCIYQLMPLPENRDSRVRRALVWRMFLRVPPNARIYTNRSVNAALQESFTRI